MVCLPQLLYLFQNLPIYLTKAFFSKLDSIISQFLWNNKRPRIQKTHLCKPKTVGGLALPDFNRYYWAVNIHVWMYYFHYPIASHKWLPLEREDCSPYNPGAILLSPSRLPTSKYQGNEIISASISIWKQLNKHFNLSSLTPLMPIYGNPSFAPSTLDDAFKIWEKCGIQTLDTGQNCDARLILLIRFSYVGKMFMHDNSISQVVIWWRSDKSCH